MNKLACNAVFKKRFNNNNDPYRSKRLLQIQCSENTLLIVGPHGIEPRNLYMISLMGPTIVIYII